MGLFSRLIFYWLLWSWAGGAAWAQPKAAVETKTHLKAPTGAHPDSSQVSNPKSLTFTASTDQRFFFFNDTRTEDNRRTPVSVYGIRAGFLFPPKRDRPALHGGRSASFKAGAGFYFINQQLDHPGLLPNTSESVTRHLRIGTVFYERYILRRKAFEVSLPLEFGYGHSRYEVNDEGAKKHEVARGIFLPLGVGVSAAYQFPLVRWLRPLHWFGLNFLTGYRFILKKDIPESQINYTGLYLSVGPSFFLENLTADIKYWRTKRKSKKITNSSAYAPALANKQSN
ncbi:hypothetical protein [Spirosoma sp. KNUC1025]|uniref:hypothetical protein n=1 Tax=Spirosoma sp. KNUC1025 TaxID=2894082 RepID=UPI00386F70BE|nr:hypothetical protein LN737_10240 [Spirosoma sp. KNUC1025]